MPLREVSADHAVRPVATIAVPSRVLTLTRFRLGRTLKAEVGVFLSMLSAGVVWLFSTEVKGIPAAHQHLGKSLCNRKLAFLTCFKCLLLFGLLLFCFASWWNSSLFYHHYQMLVNQTKEFYLPYSYIPEPTTVAPTHPPTTASTAARVQFHEAHPHNYHYIIDNKEACEKQTPFLVLMVPVAPKNLAARDAIRQTWGNQSRIQGEVVLTMFMLGATGGANVEQLQEKLKQENEKHNDLIQSDFMDTYKNLTIKTMVIMHWLATRCPSAAYAMKVDSDMFLNIDNLVIMLQKPDIPKLNYLTGYMMWNRPVVRSKQSKWYVPEEMYPEPRYPTYTLGMGYVFSNDLPAKFVEVSKSIKPFNIEDAYIGMCMKKLELKPSGPPNPSQFKAYNSKYDRCSFSKVITYILGSSKQLIDIWTDLKKPGPPCPGS